MDYKIEKAELVPIRELLKGTYFLLDGKLCVLIEAVNTTQSGERRVLDFLYFQTYHVREDTLVQRVYQIKPVIFSTSKPKEE